MTIIKNVTIKHRIGNIICGFCNLLDGIVSIISLGNVNLDLVYSFSVYRMKNDFLMGRKK